MGEVPVVSMKPGDSLHLQVDEFEWDLVLDRDLGEIQIVALTDIRPMGVVLGSGHIQIILSETVFHELNKAGNIEKTAQLVLESSDLLMT